MTPPDALNNINIYELTENERKSMGIDSLPGSLAEALTELDRDSVVCEALGPTLYEAFVRARTAEWETYRISVTDWEIERYMEQV